MGSGFAKMKKQARAMQEQFEKARTDLQQKTFIGSSGNGLVTITLDGEHTMKEIKIKPECVDPNDLEGLEDLIRSAYTQASEQIEASTPGMSNFMPF